MDIMDRILTLCLTVLILASCATTQSRYSMLGSSYPPKPEGYDIQVFHDAPQRLFVRISRLDVHLEKTHFVGSSLDDALQELKKQARLSGADAIVDIREHSSMVGETRIYHVTAIGIRYTE
ncbi:Putative heavy-metal-binding [Nitrosospira multiformis]|uniref:Putative heavy-metal-binding n=2 Tax=Nitrosospira multiformis TaxID=1231 RepID=A0A1H8IJF7_9PROT|nr:Putative heavy-metal-binding [Nitrosospira multiformis]